MGPVLHLPGLQRPRRLDAHVEQRRRHRRVRRDDRRRRATATSTATAPRSARSRRQAISVPVQDRRRAWRRRTSPSTARTTARSCAQAERQVGRRPPDAGAAEGADAVVQPDEGAELQGLPRDDGAAHQLVEQHDLRRRRRQHRLLPRQLRPAARPEVRLDAAGRRQRPGHRVERRAVGGRDRRYLREPGERLALQHEQLAVVGGRRRAARRRPTSRRTSTAAARTRAASTPSGVLRATGRTSRSTRCSRRRTTATCPPFAAQIPALVKAWDAAAGWRRAAGRRLAEPIALLRAWDFRWAVDSVPTTLAVFWGEEVGRLRRRRGPEGRACRPTTTSRRGAGARAARQALADGLRPARPPTSAPGRRRGATSTASSASPATSSSRSATRARASRSASRRRGGARSRRSARAPVRGHEEVVRHERQQLRGGRGVRRPRFARGR